ncbi:hypothetical protein COB28_02050 [Candidatus Dependentiae bacterium]|nr:MAG: hypothetical protein COB28_02050 [Candidatus Dependentiae bacterium]
MITQSWLSVITDTLLLIPFLFILLGSIAITIQTRWIQIRQLPLLGRTFLNSLKKKDPLHSDSTIPSYKALFTAMSTTIGTANIVGPIVAIGHGGPGALAGFLLATLFGCATTYVETCFALSFRSKNRDGSINGGPMPYVKEALGPFWAYLYAAAGALLLIAWCSNQSNTTAMLLEPLGISPTVTGLFLGIGTTIILSGGIQRLGSINAILVPYMFLLYCGSCLTILAYHADQIIPSLKLIFTSLGSSTTPAGFVGGLGWFYALRWGLARALQSNEAGVGTSTFPHSASTSADPFQQGTLAMISVYTNGLLCLLTGLVILSTGAWAIPGAHFDVMMMQHIFVEHFSSFGSILFGFSSFLFAIGTILGNGYNGGECFKYLMPSRLLKLYYIAIGSVVFIGSIADVQTVWTIVDFFIIPVIIPHMIALLILTRERTDLWLNVEEYKA